MRLVTLIVTLLVGGAALACAGPVVRVDYPGGIPRIQLTGDWSGSHYQVSRSANADGVGADVLTGDVLCTGECFVFDRTASLGASYWYRFAVQTPDGSLTRYGPFPVTIAPELASGMRLAVSPSPARGPLNLTLGLAGSPSATPTAVTASVFDAAGRRVATPFDGALPAGTTRIAWAPRRADGSPLAAGVYLLRFVATDGRVRTTRFVITH